MNSAAKPVQAESKEPGFFSKIGKFLREVRAEFKRVQWPSRRETIVCTITVDSSCCSCTFLGIGGRNNQFLCADAYQLRRIVTNAM